MADITSSVFINERLAVQVRANLSSGRTLGGETIFLQSRLVRMLALFDVQLTHLARYAVMEMRSRPPHLPAVWTLQDNHSVGIDQPLPELPCPTSNFLQFVQVIQPAVLQH